MAAEYYIYTSCDGQQYETKDIVNGSLTIGGIYNLEIQDGLTNNIISCFEIGSGNTLGTSTIVSASTIYNTCLECAINNNFSFFVVSCDNPLLNGPVNAYQFSEYPLSGDTYQLCANNGEFDGCQCFTVRLLSPESYMFDFVISGPYLNRCECTEQPRSANTESTICVICCECTENQTITSVSPPHPVWTDSQGTSVTQLNAITLGGMNGLNN